MQGLPGLGWRNRSYYPIAVSCSLAANFIMSFVDSKTDTSTKFATNLLKRGHSTTVS